METLVAIDPGTALSDAANTIATSVNSNLGTILTITGGLLAVGVVIKLLRRFAK